MSNPFFAKLSAKALTNPDDVCFDLHGMSGLEKSLTFSHMRKRIADTAQSFSEHGVREGDVVLIFAQHSEGMLLAFFGAQWLGAIPSFMPPPTIKQDLASWASAHQKIVERIDPKLIISEQSCIGHVGALRLGQLISTEVIENWPAKIDRDAVTVDLDQIAFLQHSSGTTGLKKGVTVTYRQLLSQLDAYGRTISFDGSANVISWLPIYHDMGLIAATLLPMWAGASVRLIDTFAWLSNPGILISLLAKYSRSYCWLPNFAFNYLAKRSRVELSDSSLEGVRAVINCSEPCKQNDMLAFINRFESHGLSASAVQVCYAAAEYVFGMTQTSFCSPLNTLVVDAHVLETENRVTLDEGQAIRSKTIVEVGKPIEGAEIRIGDNIADGIVDEIIIRGPSLCNGYFKNEETTRKKFKDGWYHTGDLGFRYDGKLYVTGRIDDLVIVRGKNIYAHDVEELASTIKGVKLGRVTAFGIDDASGTQQLILAVEATGDVAAKTMKAQLNDSINTSFGIIPADTVIVEENSLIKTTSGKISRSANQKAYLNKTIKISKSARSVEKIND
ncbi:MAG TPA: hypothetical protein DEB63_18220 [Agrobacterium sp.]|uniref:AMP-binding protein n=1 Tax=Rhizobium TaxID=379 RepID=UPI000E8D904A|nr:hypothetical protein [Agrobacterium sp.]